jgi:hypothetical protein
MIKNIRVFNLGKPESGVLAAKTFMLKECQLEFLSPGELSFLIHLTEEGLSIKTLKFASFTSCF